MIGRGLEEEAALQAGHYAVCLDSTHTGLWEKQSVILLSAQRDLTSYFLSKHAT